MIVVQALFFVVGLLMLIAAVQVWLGRWSWAPPIRGMGPPGERSRSGAFAYLLWAGLCLHISLGPSFADLVSWWALRRKRISLGARTAGPGGSAEPRGADHDSRRDVVLHRGHVARLGNLGSGRAASEPGGAPSIASKW